MRLLRVAALGLAATVATGHAGAADSAANSEELDRFSLVVQGETYVEVFRRVEMLHFIENAQPGSNYH